MPVTAPALKARSRPWPRLFCAATAVRTLARTDTFMPMKPVAPDSTAPIRKPTAEYLPRQDGEHDEDDDAHDGDGRVLAAQIGARTFLDRLRDLLHARRAGVGGHDARGGDDAIQHGDHAAADDGPKNGRHSG